ncbi:MAG: iron ABC transporter permease [Alphaproteobacteria bacterium]|nr:iron ABC transporter permease [Alphaproteobacteria bacterium]
MSTAVVETRPRRNPVPLLVSCGLLAVGAVLLAVFLGVVAIAPAEIVAVLTGKGSGEARSIILDIRLPRIVTGVLAGIHFAIAGLLLQAITRNPLADPSVMGVSQGATLGVTLFLLFSVYLNDPGSTARVTALPLEWLPAVGMLGGLLAGAFIYLLAFRRDLGPLRVTLCGVAVGSILHALAIGLIAGWGSARIDVLLEWLAGSLYARSWDHALFLAPFTVAGLLALYPLRRALDLLQFDPAVARSFGLSYRLHFSLALLLACGLAASAVGVVGPIVFVGLIVPHLARTVTRGRPALVLPAAIALGAIVVTLADLVGRLAGRADEIPIGVVTAICGAPVLIALLRRVP